MDFQLRHLRSFVAVAEELHFGRAASRLGISQPVVSRHVRALEAALGTPLFVRTARATVLTDAAREVLTGARETLAAAERVTSRARASANGVRGRVTVGFVWSTIDPYLAPLVDAMGARKPEIKLEVTHVRWLDVLPSLRRGSVDLVIGRRMGEAHEMQEMVIHTEPYLIAVPVGHRFAAREEISIEDLDGEPIVALNRSLGPARYDAAFAELRARGVESKIAMHAGSPQVALALVGAGFGVHRIPASAAKARRDVAYTRLSDVDSQILLFTRPGAAAPALVATMAIASGLLPRSQAMPLMT